MTRRIQKPDSRRDSKVDEVERPLPFQFGIRSLLTVTAGFSIVFALLQGIGLDATSFFLGFLIFGIVALFGMFCVEASGAIGRSVKRNCHARDPWRPRFDATHDARLHERVVCRDHDQGPLYP